MATRLGVGKGYLFVFRCGFDQRLRRVLTTHDSPKKTREARAGPVGGETITTQTSNNAALDHRCLVYRAGVDSLANRERVV